jgi:hypothetical protein
MQKKIKKPLPKWRVIRIKGTPAVYVGAVEAPDVNSAVREAIKKYDITDPRQQSGLAAYRWS